MSRRAIGSCACAFVVSVAACNTHGRGVSAGPSASPPSAAMSVASSPAPARPPRPRSRATAGRPLPPPAKAPPESAPTAGCGTARVDDLDVPLDCNDESAQPPQSGALVVARAELQPDDGYSGALALPELVDHRQDGTEGPVRNQGEAGSCTTFALAAALDHALARREGQSREGVSTMHLWSRYHVANGALAIADNMGQPVARESDWPYDQRVACSWQEPRCGKDMCKRGGLIGCSAVDAAAVARADAKPYARLLHVTRVEKPSAATLKKILAAGQDVYIGMRVGGAAWSGKAVTKENPVIADYDPAKAPGAHELLVAGYRTQPNGTYFLLHNSWGSGWGDGGYAWLHETELRALKVVMIIDAVSADSGETPVASPSQSCPNGVPDAKTLKCAARCADGGPRIGGECPTSQGCGAGEVQVAGACVRAAPNVSGTSKSGVRFECAAGGCVYTLAAGQLGCNQSGATCAHACPAPDYLLADGTKGLYCTE